MFYFSAHDSSRRKSKHLRDAFGLGTRKSKHPIMALLTNGTTGTERNGMICLFSEEIKLMLIINGIAGN